jgi:hypothetical protein
MCEMRIGWLQSSETQSNNLTVAAPLLANINEIADCPLPNDAVTGLP